MMSNVITLNNGYKMPLVGLGTGGNTREEIRTALDMGYRHIDTAYSYENEEMIGDVLQEYFTSGKLKREDVFITSKLWPAFHKDNRTSLCLEESLKKLRLDYVDLYLDHFPGAFAETGVGEDRKMVFEDVKIEEVWKAMEQLVKQGKAKSIGVSNYNMAQVTRILNIAEIKPVINQVECHLYLQQPKMHQFLKERNITLTAYSPLGAPHMQTEIEAKALENPVAKQLATKYNKTVGQILLRHMVQRDIIVIPQSGNPERQKDNMNIFDFHLNDDDIAQLAAQDKKMRFNDVPSFKDHPEYPFNEPV